MSAPHRDGYPIPHPEPENPPTARTRWRKLQVYVGALACLSGIFAASVIHTPAGIVLACTDVAAGLAVFASTPRRRP